MKRIYIVGASGMVASRVVDLIKENFEVVPLDEKTLDITNQTAINTYFANLEFDAIVNFAAFTNVDAAEAQSGDKNGLAWKLNVDGPRYLAEVCNQKGKFYLHISTDFVFPGNEVSPGPYAEDAFIPDDPSGIGWYGWTKNRAEKAISDTKGVKSAIVRYGYPFRASEYPLKKDWARNLISLYNEHKLYPLFTDQVQSIIFIDDLALPITKILESEQTGVFHVASYDTTTPYQVAKYLLQMFTGENIELQEGSMVEFLKAPGRTPRPRLGGLYTDLTQKRLGLKFRSWKEMVDSFVSQLSS